MYTCTIIIYNIIYNVVLGRDVPSTGFPTGRVRAGRFRVAVTVSRADVCVCVCVCVCGWASGWLTGAGGGWGYLKLAATRPCGAATDDLCTRLPADLSSVYV